MALSLAVKMGSGATLEGNATVGDVLKGVTFYNDDPSEVRTGTLELTGDASAGDVKSGKTFYNTNAKSIQTGTFASQEKSVTSSVSDQTVTPDSGKYLSKVTVNKLTMSGTYTTTTRGTAVDMGASNTYRYVNTNGVTNTNSGTYTYASGSTGGTVDLGMTNTYRYVNAANVYAKGKTDSASTMAGRNFSSQVNSVTLTKDVKYIIIWATNSSSTIYGYPQNCTVNRYSYVNEDNVRFAWYAFVTGTGKSVTVKDTNENHNRPFKYCQISGF